MTVLELMLVHSKEIDESILSTFIVFVITCLVYIEYIDKKKENEK